MFDDGAFEIPDSFDADDIDIFAELGVSGNNPVSYTHLTLPTTLWV